MADGPRLGDAVDRLTRDDAATSGKLPALPRRRGRAAAAWILFLLALGGVTAAAYAGRHEVVRLWPPAYQLYDLLEVPVDVPLVLNSVPAAGFEIQDVIPQYRMDGADVILHVSGIISNTSDRPLTIPPVVILVLDADGGLLHSQAARLDVIGALEPGAVQPFEASLETPGPGADRLEVTFDSS